MKKGFFIDKQQMNTLGTLAEVLLEGRQSERAAGAVLHHTLAVVKSYPTEIEDQNDIATRDAYWDKVEAQWEADRLSNQPAMEGWDAIWAEAHNRLIGGNDGTK